jgi:hypothetical protein
MSTVKTYTISTSLPNGINYERLHSSIFASLFVTDFEGITQDGDELFVQGASLYDEPGLDGLISGHDPTPTVVIEDVTPRQIRQALILSGVSMASIDAALATLPEPNKSLAQAEWEYSNMFERSRPLVTSVGQMLGWTSAQLDALWIFAKTL